MDELLSMRLFVKVADWQSFARAAADLNISNSSATRLIMSLEDRLATRLLNRTTRSLSLTDAGRIYLNQIRRVIDEIDHVEETIASLNHEPIGSLRIVAPVMFGMQVLAPALGSFKRRHPNVVPEVTIVDRHVDLASEGFDVGLLLTQRISGVNTVRRVLTRLALVVCASRQYVEQHGRPTHPRDLECHACLLFHSDYAGEYLLFECDDAHLSIRPNKSASSNNMGLIRQFVLDGMGVAILPSFLVEQDIRDGRLLPLLDGYRIQDLEMNIAYPSRRHFPRKARLFVDHVLEHFAA
ncbi:LysR family transcriptional regulator [Burkholderia pyrrocinia]|uniref:LysR family transcriptional regulator n=1 Tax=Burkholderia pyrrocinia TaxID=60550 RepID=A0A2Z5MWA7_BURPY|nr:LysR family transcriptional regulator [Burkholderia pyrrocinia]AXF21633.1 LysR family transcriptional regulator [Burkholderia pyrrocinia]